MNGKNNITDKNHKKKNKSCTNEIYSSNSSTNLGRMTKTEIDTLPQKEMLPSDAPT